MANGSFGQAPVIEWAHCFGGTQEDGPYSILRAIDHGFVLVGQTASVDGDVSGNHGNGDAWIVKLDSMGNLQWQKCFGGTNMDIAYQIIQTQSGGYIFTGSTLSNDGDVSGNHSLNTADVWVVKIDDLGNIIWQHCYGGTDGDVSNNMDTTFDGGCIITGATRSNDGDVSGHHPSPLYNDIWVIKIDSMGTLQWQKCLGGSNNDEGWSVKQTADGGYIVGGFALSFDGDITNPLGSYDFWLVKLNSVGAIQWQKSLGGSNVEKCYSVIQDNDGGYVAVGLTNSNDINVSGFHGGNYDCWVVKVDSGGNFQWQGTFGGSAEDGADHIEKTDDGGYIVSGYTESNDGDVSGNHSTDADCWVIKLDSNGTLQWQICLGGIGDDYGNSIVRVSDSEYVVGSPTFSNDGDVNGNHGIIDMWVVKLVSLPDKISAVKNSITDFTTYQNTSGDITVNFFANGNEKIQAELLDITSRILFSQPFAVTEGFNKKEIQTPPLVAGIYLIRLESETGSVARKVVVE